MTDSAAEQGERKMAAWSGNAQSGWLHFKFFVVFLSMLQDAMMAESCKGGPVGAQRGEITSNWRI